MDRSSAPRRVLLAGGGTAGHTSPLLATADALRRAVTRTSRSPRSAPPRGLETRVIPEAGYALELIPPVPLPRRPNADLLRTPGRVRGGQEGRARGDRPAPARRGRRASAATSRSRRTSRRASAGCPWSCTRATRCPGSPTSSAPGSPTRSPPASRTPPLRHARYIGLPIRRMISTLDRAALRAEARESFGLDPDRPTLLVTGGSQGARRLNQSVAAAAPAFAAAGVQVLHILGPEG